MAQRPLHHDGIARLQCGEGAFERRIRHADAIREVRSRRARRERHRTYGHVFGRLELEKRELRRLEREARGLLHVDAVRRRREPTQSHDACLESLARPHRENGMNLHCYRSARACSIGAATSCGVGRSETRQPPPSASISCTLVVIC